MNENSGRPHRLRAGGPADALLTAGPAILPQSRQSLAKDRIGDRYRCDVFKVAEQCGVRLFDSRDHSPASRRPGECFVKPTLRAIGRAHGEAHLALVLRLIVESRDNAGELYAETIKAVSIVVRSGLVEAGSELFEAFDAINLAELRAWAQAVRGKAATSEIMAGVLLWRLANPTRLRSAA